VLFYFITMNENISLLNLLIPPLPTLSLQKICNNIFSAFEFENKQKLCSCKEKIINKCKEYFRAFGAKTSRCP